MSPKPSNAIFMQEDITFRKKNVYQGSKFGVEWASIPKRVRNWSVQISDRKSGVSARSLQTNAKKEPLTST
jgi:hypothetical protein